MLPDIDLDQERFDDIVDEAKNRIISIYPQWTDFNYHDPGITLIELFAWLKEIQQFTMNRMVEQNRQGYFRLLGMERRHREAAEAEIEATAKEEARWEKGMAFYAGEIAFETTEPVRIRKGTTMITLRQTETVAEITDYSGEQIEKRTEGGHTFLRIKGETLLAITGKVRLFLKYNDHYYESDFQTKCGENGLYLEIRNFTMMPHSIRLLCFSEAEEARLYLGEGNGFPGQVIDVGDRNLEYESFRIMIHNCHVFYEWQRVADFYHSGYGDRHYMFDETSGVLLFGDGEHGLPPVGGIYIVQAVRTLGSGGNVKAGMIRRIKECGSKWVDKEQVQVTNPKDARGGRDTEHEEDTWNRYGQQFRSNLRLITAADYEKAVREIGGLWIESCKVLPPSGTPNQVEIVIKPASRSGRGKLKKEEERQILRELEKRRMVGTRIKLYTPKYAELSLYARIAAKPQYAEARKQLTAQVKEYFRQLGSQFGAHISHSEVYGMLDAQEGVFRVDYLTMNIRGPGTGKDENGNLFLPPNGLILLKDLQISFYEGGY